MTLICTALLFAGSEALAAGALPPTQRLAISFDLPAHELTGQALIKLPSNTGADIELGDLTVTGLQVNGERTEMPDARSHIEIEAQGKAQEVTVTYKKLFPPLAGPAAGIIDKDGISLTGFWHPILDRDTFYELTATVPSGFEAVSEADEITTTPAGEDKKVRFFFPHPLGAINFAAGPYVVKRALLGGDKEIFTYFFPEDQDLADGFLKKTIQYLKRYTTLIGPYPYKRFSVVENILPTGYGMPTFTLLGRAVVRLPFIQDTSLGHEVLHSWFGNGVLLDNDHGNWSEGLTTYMADQEYARDEGRDTAFRKGQLLKYQSYVLSDNTISLAHFYGTDGRFAGREAERAVGYGKASMVFHMLNKALGEEVFLKSLADFYARMKYQRAGWVDLAASFENQSHVDLKEFFDQWLNRTDIPVLAVDQLKLYELEGQLYVSFNLIQKNRVPYRLDVPVIIKAGHEEIKKTYTIQDAETPVTILLDAIPTEMIVDRDYDLMRTLTPDELPAVWSRFAGDPQKIAVMSSVNDSDNMFAPLIERLQAMGCRLMAAADVQDKDLADSSVIFLDPGLETSRAMFAEVRHPAAGFTVDVRQNPLNPGHVAVLVSGENEEEISKGAAKLSHYGKYGFLHFEGGRILEKRTRETDNGQHYTLDEAPRGVEIQTTRPFAEIVDKLAENRVIYVGEAHTRYADHRLQERIIRVLYGRDPRLAIGMEMFARSSQDILDAYLDRRLDERTFLKQSRYFEQWGYDYRHYQGIIDYARRNHIPVIGLNLEKDTVSKVFKENGIAALEPEEKKTIPADRDLDLPGYRQRIAEAFQAHDRQQTARRGFKNFFQAQALWDETMAETIAAYLQAHPETRLVVLAGRGHVLKESGIPPRVARRLTVKQAVVVNAGEDNIDMQDVDYLLFTPPVSLPAAPKIGVLLAEDKEGLRISAVSPHGKAGRFGIKKGDVILAVDGQATANMTDLKVIMFYKKPGDRVTIRIKRPRRILPDETKDIEITL